MLSDAEMLQKLVAFYDKDAKRQGLDLNGRWNEIARIYKDLRSRPEEKLFARATSFREAVEQVEPKFHSMIAPELTELIQADGQAVPPLSPTAEAGGHQTTSPSEREPSKATPLPMTIWDKLSKLEELGANIGSVRFSDTGALVELTLKR